MEEKRESTKHPQKAWYETPCLTIHGSVETITQDIVGAAGSDGPYGSVQGP